MHICDYRTFIKDAGGGQNTDLKSVSDWKKRGFKRSAVCLILNLLGHLCEISCADEVQHQHQKTEVSNYPAAPADRM